LKIPPLELDRGEVSIVPVAADRIVEHFDVIQDIPPGILAGFIDLAPDPLAL